MTDFGPEIQPGTPEYEWAARVIRAVEARTGQASRWNGKLYEELDDRLLGTAHDDGSMTLGRAKVLDPIRTAYAAGPNLTDEQRDDARQAMIAGVHEARHLCSPLGEQSNLVGSVKLYDPEEIALEEGLIDTWTHRHVDGVIQDIDMDIAVPGVIGATAAVGYPAYNQATDALVNGLSDVTQIQPDQVRRQLHETDRTQRWNAAADMVIDKRLGGMIPPDHHLQVQHRLSVAMRMEFAKLPAVQLSGLVDEKGLENYGRAVGRDAIGGLNRTLADLEEHYSAYQNQPEAAPRQRMSMQDIIRQRQQASQQAAQQAGQPAAQQSGPAVDPEIAHLRKFLGAQQPVAQSPAATGDGAAPNNVRQLRAKDQSPARE